MPDFREFPKIPRLYKGHIVITEKIDGTNAQIHIEATPKPDAVEKPEGALLVDNADDEFTYLVWAGSRNRWLGPGKADNFAFFHWVQGNAARLATGLGPGTHYGEWWGHGIQRGYSQTEKNFSLFNVGRWYDPHMPRATLSEEDEDGPESIPFIDGLSVVPVLYHGPWFGRPADPVQEALRRLEYSGSSLDSATPAEGVMIYHEASGYYLKAPFEKNHKGTG